MMSSAGSWFSFQVGAATGEKNQNAVSIKLMASVSLCFNAKATLINPCGAHDVFNDGVGGSQVTFQSSATTNSDSGVATKAVNSDVTYIAVGHYVKGENLSEAV